MGHSVRRAGSRLLPINALVAGYITAIKAREHINDCLCEKGTIMRGTLDAWLRERTLVSLLRRLPE